MGTLTKIEESGNMDSGKITLTVNGDVKQDGRFKSDYMENTENDCSSFNFLRYYGR